MTATARLRPLLPADETAALRAHEELAGDGFTFLFDWPDDGSRSWADYLADVERIRRGEVAPGRVPATFLVAVDGDDTLVGRVSVRHELNGALSRLGGHVGYGVRPAYRRRGHATAMLRGGLALLPAHGVERALVTCADDNTASATTIERCGGALESVVVDDDGRPNRRYWIDVTRGEGRN